MHTPFTQTKEYLSWHAQIGEKTYYKEFYTQTENGKVLIATASFLVIELKIGKVLYCPYGPVFFVSLKKVEKNKIIKEIHELAVNEDCVFVRLEDENGYLKNTKYLFNPFKKTFSSEGIFQPRMEWWLDLKESSDDLLNRVHKDHKYSIRRAQKEGIEVEIISHDLHNHFSEFWKLMETTSLRDLFTLHQKEYYQEIFKTAGETHEHDLKKFLVFTKLNGEYLSVALILIKDHIANLAFAGSVSEKRELGFNHLMQWSAILEAKNRECEIYNFGGIFENGYGKKGLQGVTNFKNKFGGYAKFHGNFLDMPIKKLRYCLYIIKKML